MKHPHLSTPRERFAQEVAAGKNQSEAYRLAYPKSRNWKDSSVHSKASTLMADVKVSARVTALLSQTEKACAMSRDAWLNKWMDVERDSKSLHDRREALREIGKALGYYKCLERVAGTTGIIMLPAQIDAPVGELPPGFWESQALGTPRAL